MVDPGNLSKEAVGPQDSEGVENFFSTTERHKFFLI